MGVVGRVFSVIAIGAMLVGIAPVNHVSAIDGDASFRNHGGYGIDFGGAWTGSSANQMETSMGDADDVGVGWVRLNAFWSTIQASNSSSYDWSSLDQAVAAAKAHNKQILLLPHTTPEWARPAGAPMGFAGDKYAPANVNDYATFFSKLVERYAPQGVLDYEVWNEPNISNFWKDSVANPNPNPVRYTQLLQAAASAGRAQNSSINIVSGGMSPAADSPSSVAPRTFLEAIYANGGKNSFDAVGFHPYSVPAMPSAPYEWNAWQQMNETSFDNGNITQASLRGIMTSHNDASKKIWITEYGAPTSGNGDTFTEAEQQSMFQEAINLHKTYNWVGPMFLYTMYDFQPYGASSDREDYFGLKRSDGGSKPAFTSIKALIEDTMPPVVGDYHALPVKDGFRIQPDVSDNVGVIRIDVLVDGVVVRSVDASTLSHVVYLDQYTPGSHTYSVVAYDAAGNSTTGALVSFIVPVVSVDDGGVSGGNGTNTQPTGGAGQSVGAPDTGWSTATKGSGGWLLIFGVIALGGVFYLFRRPLGVYVQNYRRRR